MYGKTIWKSGISAIANPWTTQGGGGGLQHPIWTPTCKGQRKICSVYFLNVYISSCIPKINNPPNFKIMIQMDSVRFVHAWNWISVSNILVWRILAKAAGGTNFSRESNNVLQAYDHKTQSLMKKRGQQKCLDKAQQRKHMSQLTERRAEKHINTLFNKL